jgi:hypothetical protein
LGTCTFDPCVRRAHTCFSVERALRTACVGQGIRTRAARRAAALCAAGTPVHVVPPFRCRSAAARARSTVPHLPHCASSLYSLPPAQRCSRGALLACRPEGQANSRCAGRLPLRVGGVCQQQHKLLKLGYESANGVVYFGVVVCAAAARICRPHYRCLWAIECGSSVRAAASQQVPGEGRRVSTVQQG